MLMYGDVWLCTAVEGLVGHVCSCIVMYGCA